MFVFFIKFSFLLSAFNTSTALISFLIFLNLIVGLFFYLQLFKISSNVNKKYLLQLFVANAPLRLRNQQNVIQPR